MINYLIYLILYFIEITSNAKKDNVIPLHKGISLKTIQKYNIGL